MKLWSLLLLALLLLLLLLLLDFRAMLKLRILVVLGFAATVRATAGFAVRKVRMVRRRVVVMVVMVVVVMVQSFVRCLDGDRCRRCRRRGCCGCECRETC